MRDDTKTKVVSLTLTESCNLDCIYCYENHKSRKKLDYYKAINIIDSEMSDLQDFTSVEFDFFGGEPFLAFDTLKAIYEYIKSKKYAIKHVCFASTNGTLVHGEIKEWLKANPDFICGLSLDGDKDVQNFNRSKSFEKIDIDFFAKQYPEQEIKMTISNYTLPKLAQNVIFCHEKGFKVACNLAYGLDWSEKDNRRILQEQLSLLIDYYLCHTNITPCSLLSYDINDIATEDNATTSKKWCGAGINMRVYDSDGILYPCHFFMPVSIGEKSKEIKDLKFELRISKEKLDEKCRSCVVERICPTCYGANYAQTGNMYKKDDNLCNLTKIIIKANSFFRAQQWKKGLLNISTMEEQAMLRSIKKIQQGLIID